MSTYDDEKFILEDFKMISSSKVIYFGNWFKCRKIYFLIKHAKWIDSSSKQALPPDFYSDKHKIMMELMAINDSAYEKDGKIYNPEKKRKRLNKALFSMSCFSIP